MKLIFMTYKEILINHISPIKHFGKSSPWNVLTWICMNGKNKKIHCKNSQEMKNSNQKEIREALNHQTRNRIFNRNESRFFLEFKPESFTWNNSNHAINVLQAYRVFLLYKLQLWSIRYVRSEFVTYVWRSNKVDEDFWIIRLWKFFPTTTS